MRLGDTRRNRADAVLADQLHVHAGLRVGVLEVVDQLRQVLDRVDVVVRRRYQADTRRGVPHLGHPGIDLVARSGRPHRVSCSSALSRIPDVGAVGQVVAGDAESRRRHLLMALRASRRSRWSNRLTSSPPSPQFDRPPSRFIAMARVWAPRRRSSRSSSRRSRTVRRSRSPLDLVERNRRADTVFELQQTAQRRHLLALLVVDQLGVLLEDRVLPGARRCWSLNTVSGLNRWAALAAPLVFAADLEFRGVPTRRAGPGRPAHAGRRRRRRCRRGRYRPRHRSAR